MLLIDGGAVQRRGVPRTSWTTLAGGRVCHHWVVTELSDFLRSRRAKLAPVQVGLTGTDSPRRVPGLRREELAMLAGVSVDYYVRLEQGRAGVHPSDSVVDALAAALQLDPVEHAHLRRLAQIPRAAPQPEPPEAQRVRPELQRLLDRLQEVPAFVLGRRMDVLAWNALAARLIVDFAALKPVMRNMPRLVFLDDAARHLYPDWDDVAPETVAYLRFEASRDPDDAQLHELIGELSTKSSDFGTWWADRDVREKAFGTKRLRHPQVGDLELEYETLALPADARQQLVTYTAAAGSPSQTALKLLALGT